MPGPSSKSGDAGLLTRSEPPAPERIEIRAYRLLTRLARPAAPLLLHLRARNGKEDPSRRGERFGRASQQRPAGALVWVHAASVGETSSVLPLIAGLAVQRPDLGILLTTGTVTSARFAAVRLGATTTHQYVPLDSPAFVANFLDHWRPNLAVFTEQEIWPNLVLEAHARAIPLALINARMSDTSFERWQRRAGLATALFSRFSVVLAQNEMLAGRFGQLGAVRALAAGNLKIDAPPPPVDAMAFAALNGALDGRPRVIAASTHDSEELAVGRAHQALEARYPGLVTLLAPRHPERGEAIAQALAEMGLKVSRRSSGALPASDTNIYLADTIGELGTLYASAPVAFLGGSLIAHGGQNPIEAVRHGAAVVTGPSTYNFADVYDALAGTDAVVRIEGPDGLAAAFDRLLADPVLLDAMRVRATSALEKLSGALALTVDTLLPYLPEEPARLSAATGS